LSEKAEEIFKRVRKNLEREEKKKIYGG